MSILISGTNNIRLDGTETDPPDSTSFTICGWVKPVSIEGWAYRAIISYDDGNSWLGMWLVGEELSLESSADYLAFPSFPAMNQWFFFALTCAGTGAADLKGYWAAIDDAGFVSQQTAGVYMAGTWDEVCVRLGHDAWYSALEADFAYIKIWNAVLSEAELLQEKARGLPVRLEGLYLFSPLWGASLLENYVGNGEAWTSNNPADADMPPVSYGIALPLAPGSITHDLAAQDAVSNASVEGVSVTSMYQLAVNSLMCTALLGEATLIDAAVVLTLRSRVKAVALQERQACTAVPVRMLQLRCAGHSTG